MQDERITETARTKVHKLRSCKVMATEVGVGSRAIIAIKYQLNTVQQILQPHETAVVLRGVREQKAVTNLSPKQIYAN